MSRRKGRILAFQALYSHDLVNKPLEELLKFDWDKSDESSAVEGDGEKEDSSSKEDSYDYARLLIAGTINHLEEIDGIIKAHLSEKWTMERLNKVALAVMRISVFSLLNQKDISPSIVINEAVAIAKDFGAEDSYKFINAVLDKISKETAS
ncbi:transcription antitermination factor NusB [Treponema sp.]|uniref:transcription antitermination factor NusB n=1 Tax=Treponema sp. TaxID=166 RepID=UPI0025EA60C5|nr:transcription antitermination factor NusB [Treponema sp.]MCR5218568.1 transcription antitermination factor NusB [Treponema sp.]